ncbi:MAG: dockerin type I repeat-containing protein [Ruminococcus sp.]|nr:dockerin type I repeat-containing protein [Ruminococcus sp.]
MFKKSKTAVLTALTVMLSAFSPLATYADNVEPVETIPDRNSVQELIDAPEVLDGEPVQTTSAVSTIPDRLNTCTSVPALGVQPEEFPLKRDFDVTVKVVDDRTNEHLDGVKIHFVETETLTSNVIKRDFGTWDSSQSESYIVNPDYYFTDLSSMFLLTAVIEEMPEGYYLIGGSNIMDEQIDSAMAWYPGGENYKPITELTIPLVNEYGTVKAVCNLIDGDTGEYIEGAEVSLSEWDKDGNLGNCVEWVSGGKEETIDFKYKIPHNERKVPDYGFRSTIQFVVDKLPEKYNAYTFSPFDEQYADYHSDVLEFNVYLYEDGKEHPDTSDIVYTKCASCGKSIPSDEAVKTPYNNFCKECYANIRPITTTSTTTSYDYLTTTTTTSTVIACKACDICGMMIDVNDGVTTPLGLFVCPKCKSSGAGGTRPQFPTESTTTNDFIYGDANCDYSISLADAVIIMQSLANPDKIILSEQGVLNADVYNTGDGITTSDALTIQEIMIGLRSESDLPVFTDIPD